MAQVFLILIVASLVPVSIALFRRGQLSSQLWKATGAVVFSACLQVVFVIFVDKNLLPLAYSFRFAVVGIPACLLAIIFATRTHGKGRAGATISSSIGLVIWAILITLH
jgi:hypothetical protein